MARRIRPQTTPQRKSLTNAQNSFSELVYHKLMTPQWLLDKARWDATKPDSAQLLLQIERDAREYEGILWVRLLPGGIIDENDAFTVNIRAILEHPNPEVRPSPPPRRDPMSIMIADGSYAVGVQVQDPTSYATADVGPYLGIEGDVEGTVLKDWTQIAPQDFDRAQTITRRRWPQVFDISLTQLESPYTNVLGTCSSAIDGGHSTSFWFSNTLDPTSPLDLRLYRAEEEETYNIKSIEVTIYRSCNYSDAP